MFQLDLGHKKVFIVNQHSKNRCDSSSREVSIIVSCASKRVVAQPQWTDEFREPLRPLFRWFHIAIWSIEKNLALIQSKQRCLIALLHTAHGPIGAIHPCAPAARTSNALLRRHFPAIESTIGQTILKRFGIPSSIPKSRSKSVDFFFECKERYRVRPNNQNLA